MNRDLLPYSTDMVFGTKGFDLTFTLEPTDFEQVAPSPYYLFALEDDKGPNGGVDKQDETNQKAKKSKSSKGPVIQCLCRSVRLYFRRILELAR